MTGLARPENRFALAHATRRRSFGKWPARYSLLANPLPITGAGEGMARKWALMPPVLVPCIHLYPETSTFCGDTGTAGSRQFLGQFSVLAGQTVDEQLTTPQIVKPTPGPLLVLHHVRQRPGRPGRHYDL